MITVAQLGKVYVKATQFLHPDAVEVDKSGIRYDREFTLVEDDGKFVDSDSHRIFIPLKFTYDAASDILRLDMPDGSIVVGPAQGTGRSLAINHAGLRDIEVAIVEGPWTETLSAYAGRPIHLARCARTSGAIDVFPVTLITTGSLRRLSKEVGAPVDAARFRAGIVLNNDIEHEEDTWVDRRLRIGTVTFKVRTAVPRCAIPGFNPTSGVRDQEVMKGLIKYREKASLPDGMLPGYATPGFATYAEVIEPGVVKVGDGVELLS